MTAPQAHIASPAASFARPALVREEVYLHLRAAILGGEYLPGERLSEALLGVRLGVSRTPIREALMRLTQDGLIDAEANKGVRVRRLELREVRETYVVREELDGLAAALAADAHTDADAALLKAALETLERTPQGGARQTPLDLAFHRCVAAASHNAVLLSLCGDLEVRVALIKHLSPSSNTSPQTAEQHRAILEAVLRRDPDAARAAARQHVRTFAALVIRQMQPDHPRLAQGEQP
ncbi:GntR family transcriptional regulator [Deinococcus sp.]|uniref:GntR family transcriptional regulator n=1 Tax=Deinococcus sp. TaxID=47478 RepID=UPI002600F258|nr:GntR family transcriptional regulator [Deinococcus sp.]